MSSGQNVGLPLINNAKRKSNRLKPEDWAFLAKYDLMPYMKKTKFANMK